MSAGDYLREGDELCKGQDMNPMSFELIVKVKDIHSNCEKMLHVEDSPLNCASRLGLEDMVRGFIACAQQTNTNLQTQQPGGFEEFLWLGDKIYGQTAFDEAIAHNHVGIARLLLKNAPLWRLISNGNRRVKPPISMFNGSQHDEFLLMTLEEAEKSSASVSVSVYDQQPDPKVNVKSRMDHELLALTPKNNTILHLASNGGRVGEVKDILEEYPSLIYKRNTKGETPAYVAAMEGHVDILKMMIEYFKTQNDDIAVMVTRNTDNNTALHIAIQNHHVGVIFWLMKEIPQLANHVNDFNETPFYLAAERRYAAILDFMLRRCDEKAFAGPNGKTTLHAAVISKSDACISHLLSRVTSHDQLRIKDTHGRTPWYYVIHHNNKSAAAALLEVDPNIGYEIMREEDDITTTTALHIAASRGYCEMIEVLMSKCHGCPEIIDGKGRNILHVAIENKQIEVVQFILGHVLLINLVNEGDNNRNTPVHLLASSELDIREFVTNSKLNINALNHQKLTPLDMASSNEKRNMLLEGIAMGTDNLASRPLDDSGLTTKKEPELSEREKIENGARTAFMVADNTIIVAALIATATFAAGFTVPGGLDSDQGTPILLRKPVFQAFVIANAIAFASSCSVICGHILLLYYRYELDEIDEERYDKISTRIALMYCLSGLAMLTMAVAFATSMYIMLTPSLALAISSCLVIVFIIGSTLVSPEKVLDLIGILVGIFFYPFYICSKLVECFL